MTSHAAVVARGMGKPCVAGCEELTIDARRGRRDRRPRRLAEGDVITIDGGTGLVIIGAVALVPPQINEDFETILGWADDIRRLSVRANADTPEDAAKRREFGARGHRPLPHRAHVHGRRPAADGARDDPRLRRGRAARRARAAAADAAGRLRGDLRGDGGAAGDDPPARPAAARVPAAARGGAPTSGCATRIKALHETNPMLGTRGCRLGLHWPEIYEMQVRAIFRAAARRRASAPATRRSSRSCTRSSASPRSSAGCAS